MKTIRSRDNPFFKQLKKLAGSAKARSKAGLALLDGVHLVQASLDAGLRPVQMLASATGVQDGEIADLVGSVAEEVVCLDDALFAELTELKTPSGVLALIEQPQPEVSLEHSRFALLLEDIQDPGNLGSMIRSAAAAGCDAVFLSRGCTDAWSPRALRAGMGGHFALAVREAADLVATAAGFPGTCYAAALGAKTSLYDCDLRQGVAFVIGNEGAGLSFGLRQACQTVSIPMPGRVESLNAAAAAAICVFEALRQRT